MCVIVTVIVIMIAFDKARYKIVFDCVDKNVDLEMNLAPSIHTFHHISLAFSLHRAVESLLNIEAMHSINEEQFRNESVQN